MEKTELSEDGCCALGHVLNYSEKSVVGAETQQNSWRQKMRDHLLKSQQKTKKEQFQVPVFVLFSL